LTVYLDTYFLLNALMDGIVLLTASRILKLYVPWYRICASAIIGGVYACVILVMGINDILERILTYIVICLIMVIISFGYKSLKSLMKKIVVMYMVTFIFSGLLNVVYVKGLIKSANTLIILSIFGILIINKMFDIIFRKREVGNNYTKVKISNKNIVLNLNALIDTGNNLREPITGKPVCLLTEGKAKLLTNIEDNNLFVIPFNSVGKSNGLLYGFIVDYMEIGSGSEKKHVEKAMIGRYDGFFTGDKEYEVLLNPRIMED